MSDNGKKRASAYRPPEAPAAPPAAPAAKPRAFWEPDAWYERSEEFYGAIYAGGKCKFCGHPILTRLDVCDCAGMKAARDKFKRKLCAPPPAAAAAAPTPAAGHKIQEDPNRNIEPRSFGKEDQGTFL